MCKIRGTEVVSPHGIPVDLLDRLMIIKMLPYSIEEIVQIIQIRAEIEGINLDDESLALLGKIGTQSSLRHVLQLLSPAHILSSVQGKQSVDKQVVEEIKELFLDAKQSAKNLAQQNTFFGFSLSN